MPERQAAYADQEPVRVKGSTRGISTINRVWLARNTRFSGDREGEDIVDPRGNATWAIFVEWTGMEHPWRYVWFPGEEQEHPEDNIGVSSHAHDLIVSLCEVMETGGTYIGSFEDGADIDKATGFTFRLRWAEDIDRKTGEPRMRPDGETPYLVPYPVEIMDSAPSESRKSERGTSPSKASDSIVSMLKSNPKKFFTADQIRNLLIDEGKSDEVENVDDAIASLTDDATIYKRDREGQKADYKISAD